MNTNPNTIPDPSAASSDVDLVSLSINGNDTAFAMIMRRHNRLLFRSVRSILKNDDDTEDAVQEAYLRAWRALRSFRSDSRLSTWLVRIAVNEALADAFSFAGPRCDKIVAGVLATIARERDSART